MHGHNGSSSRSLLKKAVAPCSWRRHLLKDIAFLPCSALLDREVLRPTSERKFIICYRKHQREFVRYLRAGKSYGVPAWTISIANCKTETARFEVKGQEKKAFYSHSQIKHTIFNRIVLKIHTPKLKKSPALKKRNNLCFLWNRAHNFQPNRLNKSPNTQTENHQQNSQTSLTQWYFHLQTIKTVKLTQNLRDYIHWIDKALLNGTKTCNIWCWHSMLSPQVSLAQGNYHQLLWPDHQEEISLSRHSKCV